MNYSVANKKYKKYEHLLNEDPKNQLFKRKLSKYDLLRHDLDQHDEMQGGGRKSKRGKKVIKGYRVMTGGDINFDVEPNAESSNTIVSDKTKIIEEDKKILQQASNSLQNASKCDQNNTVAETAKEALAQKTAEYDTLQAAHKKLEEVSINESNFKQRCDQLKKKVDDELESLKAEIEKLKTEKSELQTKAEKYVGKLTERNNETVTGLEDIITQYHDSMANLRSSLGIKTD